MTNDNHPFRYLMRVRYSECDAQQVVFNARYAEYVDLAATEFLRLTLGDHSELQSQGLDFQVVNLTINWHASAKFDHVIDIQVKTTKVGNTSYTVEFEMYDLSAQQAVVSAHATHVMVDAKTLTKISITEKVRDQLLKGAPNQVINHSGMEL